MIDAASHEYVGADAVRRIVHGRQTRPIVGPPVHILLMAGLHELQLAEFAAVQHLLHVQILARVDDRLGHEVLQPGRVAELNDAPAVLD